MFQAIAKKGRVLPVDVPAPHVSPGSVLIKVVNSCISAGTELSKVAGSGKSLISRALEKPEKIKKALDLARSEGIAKTVCLIAEKRDTSSPTGYSVAGIVLAVGEGIEDFHPGDHVAAGGGEAVHAEYTSKATIIFPS